MISRPFYLAHSRVGDFIKAGLCILFAYAMIVQGDLLGAGSAVERQSAQLVELGVGLLNPARYPSDASKHLMVVTVDDLSLSSAKEIYPPSHRFHARLLRRILERRPKAVFIDVVLDTCREGTGELLEALDLARAQGIPVYVAAGRPAGVADGEVVPAAACSDDADPERALAGPACAWRAARDRRPRHCRRRDALGG